MVCRSAAVSVCCYGYKSKTTKPPRPNHQLLVARVALCRRAAPRRAAPPDSSSLAAAGRLAGQLAVFTAHQRGSARRREIDLDSSRNGATK